MIKIFYLFWVRSDAICHKRKKVNNKFFSHLVSNKCPVKFLGTRFRAINRFSEPCPQETYGDRDRDIFFTL
jgi:hypothetical protein